MKKLDVLSIGYGNVGKEALSPERLEQTAAKLDRELGRVWSLTRHGIWTRNGEADMHKKDSSIIDEPFDLVFVTTPSDIGEESFNYISSSIDRSTETVVVTAEKGALTYDWGQLEELIDTRLGISATVGGGSQLLRAARDQVDGGDVSRIDLVANGTLGVVMEEFEKGTVAPTVAQLVKRMGYAEPGADSMGSIIDGELGDVAKKAQIFYNYVLASEGETIDSSVIEVPQLNINDLHLLRGTDSDRRMVITFAKGSEYPELNSDSQDRLALSVSHLPNDWILSVGFMRANTDPVLRKRLQLPGVDAGYVMRSGEHGVDGVYSHSGPGAGPLPTARAMHADAVRLLRSDQE